MKIPRLGKITPYEFQWNKIQKALNKIRAQFNGEEEIAPFYIDAYVAAGKTILGGAIASHCEKTKTNLLILARTGELVDQNQEEIWNMNSKCSVFSASLGQKSLYQTTIVGTEGTVSNHIDPQRGLVEPSTGKAFIPKIILIDECHQVDWKDVLKNGDTSYSKIINHFKKLNPKLVIVGMTGSPYRGVESIKGDFWKSKIEPSIGREFLVENGYIHHTEFGHTGEGYDLSEFDSIEEAGTKDFSSSDIEKMHEKMTLTATASIMREVVSVMQNRLSALVTCAGKKHCQEAASCVPDDEYAIVTDSTGKKERKKILDGAKRGELNERGTFRYKYIFQIGCLTTGVNIPLWDTSVLLRRIGSLTLLTQLLGRGMRLLKPEHEQSGYAKSSHLVMDFSGTMAAMHEMFDDPLLEDAVNDQREYEKNLIACPKCGEMNSEHARRCVGSDFDEDDGRCGHWFKSRLCENQVRNGITVIKGCGAENDIAAKECRKCGVYLIDPNAKLMNKAYSAEDWRPVKKFEIMVAGREQDSITVKYHLDNFGIDGKQEVATVTYWKINGNGKQAYLNNFVRKLIPDYKWATRFAKMKPVNAVSNKAMLGVVSHITHRINEKGKSVVNGVRLISGTES